MYMIQSGVRLMIMITHTHTHTLNAANTRARLQISTPGHCQHRFFEMKSDYDSCVSFVLCIQFVIIIAHAHTHTHIHWHRYFPMILFFCSKFWTHHDPISFVLSMIQMSVAQPLTYFHYIHLKCTVSTICTCILRNYRHAIRVDSCYRLTLNIELYTHNRAQHNTVTGADFAPWYITLCLFCILYIE